MTYQERGRHRRTARSLPTDLHPLAAERPGQTGQEPKSLLALDSIKLKSGRFIMDEVHRVFTGVRKKREKLSR